MSRKYNENVRRAALCRQYEDETKRDLAKIAAEREQLSRRRLWRGVSHRRRKAIRNNSMHAYLETLCVAHQIRCPGR